MAPEIQSLGRPFFPSNRSRLEEHARNVTMIPTLLVTFAALAASGVRAQAPAASLTLPNDLTLLVRRHVRSR